MATYTAITDAEIDQDSPITQTLMTKYRDNLTATAEGDPSAPKIEDAALDTTVTSAGTDWVAARITGVSAGSVGTYAWVQYTTVTDTDLTPGTTVAGSALKYAGMTYRTDGSIQRALGTTLSGTWRAMGYFSQDDGSEDTFGLSLALRIS